MQTKGKEEVAATISSKTTNKHLNTPTNTIMNEQGKAPGKASRSNLQYIIIIMNYKCSNKRIMHKFHNKDNRFISLMN